MIKIVGVVGAGTMGHGIAQVFAQAGFDVRLVDVSRPMLDRAETQIRASLAKFVEKGKLSVTDRDSALGRLRMTTALEDLVDADYVVEAIVENPDAKRDLFKRLDGMTAPETILASNTSSISITLLGAATKASGQGAGHALHEPGAADEPGRVDSGSGDVGRLDDRGAALCARRSERTASKPPTTRGSSRTGS